MRGPCEAFGVGCVVSKQKRTPDSVQCCKSCGKMFDIACKRAYAPACESEHECGCANADAHFDSDSQPESESVPNASVVSHVDCEIKYNASIFIRIFPLYWEEESGT